MDLFSFSLALTEGGCWLLLSFWAYLSETKTIRADRQWFDGLLSIQVELDLDSYSRKA